MILLENIKIRKKNLVFMKSASRKKRFKKYATDIQEYFNKWVDEMILKDLEYTNQIESEIEQALIELNSRPLTESYKKISKNNDLSLYQLRKINQERLESITDAVMNGKRIFKENFNFITDVLNVHDVDIDKYSKLILDYPLDYNRKSLLDKSITEGINLILLGDEKFTNIENVAENTFQSKHSETDLENAILAGADEKEWVCMWGEHSRHTQTDGEIVDINSPFQVINDITGGTDFLMHPCDPSGSPENTYNCQCELIFYKNGEEM